MLFFTNKLFSMQSKWTTKEYLCYAEKTAFKSILGNMFIGFLFIEYE